MGCSLMLIKGQQEQPSTAPGKPGHMFTLYEEPCWKGNSSWNFRKKQRDFLSVRNERASTAIGSEPIVRGGYYTHHVAAQQTD